MKDLVTLAKQESELVLTEGQKPVARVVPIAGAPEAIAGPPVPRKLGLHPGAWVVGDDFEEALPVALLQEGEERRNPTSDRQPRPSATSLRALAPARSIGRPPVANP